MALLAPYNDSMKLGSGFNSFTQELCLDGAVTRDDTGKLIEDAPGGEKPPIQVSQQVTYKTSIIDKVSDVFDTLNINAAFTIKFGKGNVDGGADFLNVSKIKNADLTFMVSCKVINQITMDQTLTRFSPIQGLKPVDFPRVYGDSFISGFQEGGEFTAIISVRAKDRSQANTMKADASVSFTLEKPVKEEIGPGGDVDLSIHKTKRDILTENETTISVAWTGGGQHLKRPEEDWTFDTMRAVALKFPDAVAKCPMKTNAVLTKYTSLKSFHTLSVQFNPLSYENARVYTAALRDAFLDYQNIAKSLAVLALDVNAGTHKLIARGDKVEKNFAKETLKASNPNLLQNFLDETQAESMEKTVNDKSTASPEETAKKVEEPVPMSVLAPEEGGGVEEPDELATATPINMTPEEDGSAAILATVDPPKAVNPLVIDKSYPPTIYGLESARMQCRFMMNRIISEVDKVANYPEIATDETRPLPYMSPFLFNLLLPVSQAII